jgi:hypothetical protein
MSHTSIANVTAYEYFHASFQLKNRYTNKQVKIKVNWGSKIFKPGSERCVRLEASRLVASAQIASGINKLLTVEVELTKSVHARS